MTHAEYVLFAGLGVSMDRTSLCLVDASGDVIWRGTCATDPDSLAATIRHAGGGRSARIGLETGALSPWLVQGLREQDIETICLDARHVRAALSSRPNKSDVSDAEGIAQILRSGWYREVHVESLATHYLRALLAACAMNSASASAGPSYGLPGQPEPQTKKRGGSNLDADRGSTFDAD